MARTASATSFASAWNPLDDFGPEAFVLGECPDELFGVCAESMLPVEANDFEAHLPFLLEMCPDLNAGEIERLWGWKIRRTNVLRWVREKHVRGMAEAELLSFLAGHDRDAFARLVESGAIAYA